MGDPTVTLRIQPAITVLDRCPRQQYCAIECRNHRALLNASWPIRVRQRRSSDGDQIRVSASDHLVGEVGVPQTAIGDQRQPG